jgi:hypothetical protein
VIILRIITISRSMGGSRRGKATRKAPYLDYATALAHGWQIATGIIEGRHGS